jgi:hypothetical protein
MAAKYSNGRTASTCDCGSRERTILVGGDHVAVDSVGLATQLLPLAGVAIGSSATLVGQWISSHFSLVKDQEQLRRDARQERKQAILKLLDTTQQLELALDRTRAGAAPDQQQTDKDLHAMWFAIKEVWITCSPETADGAHEYCDALYNHAKRGAADFSIKRGAREKFLDQARQELAMLPMAAAPHHSSGPSWRPRRRSASRVSLEDTSL